MLRPETRLEVSFIVSIWQKLNDMATARSAPWVLAIAFEVPAQIGKDLPSYLLQIFANLLWLIPEENKRLLLYLLKMNTVSGCCLCNLNLCPFLYIIYLIMSCYRIWGGVLDKRILVQVFLSSFVCCLILSDHSKRTDLSCASFYLRYWSRNISDTALCVLVLL